ncbi:MAG: tRNA pseudouridine(55) synthase TruB [Lachnospiraceae bacterium]|nr:tRNA pseudouridine(55) synthase TruB [Lachnospiraceae bacterium]
MNEILSGILIVDKEAGYTSFDVVARLRGILKIKKIGHTGTLDPDATGVLVCCIGKGTKLISVMEQDEKEYRATMLLGRDTDTQDISGNIICERDVNVGEKEILKALKARIGTYDQLPPMYSAKKINGKKLYEYAREGKIVERKPVTVTIKDIKDINISVPKVSFSALVSKGTYIRTLIHDIGDDLGCGACMSDLRRTRAGKYDIESSHTLDEIEKAANENRLSGIILPLDSAFPDLKRVKVKDEAMRFLFNGNPLTGDEIINGCDISEGEDVLIYTIEDVFAAIYTKKDGIFKVNRMFL